MLSHRSTVSNSTGFLSTRPGFAGRVGVVLITGLLVGPVAGCTPPKPPTTNGGPEAERPTEDRSMERSRLVEEIEHDARRTASMTGRTRFAERVMAAMERVPRHEYVPEGEQRLAYVNRPLPIGEGQTISQPYIVALMTDLLDPEPGDRVLEIGTGSGYQAAVLAELVASVHSIEIVEPLARRAAATLDRLGVSNVSVRVGDGWRGWPEEAPFDGIVVTAAAPDVPPPLVEQLAPGGRLVIPVRTGRVGEELTVVTKHADGSTSARGVLPVRFVPLTGGHGRD